MRVHTRVWFCYIQNKLYASTYSHSMVLLYTKQMNYVRVHTRLWFFIYITNHMRVHTR